MSVEYFYENDLNMLYNAAVNNNPDGGEHHTKMLESYNNLVAYISHIEHWKSTALQLAKNYGVRIHSLEQHIAELEQERDYLDGRCAALENDLVLDDVVSKLENVQTRLADFENMARAFVEYKAPDHICRMHFDLMLKESEE